MVGKTVGHYEILALRIVGLIGIVVSISCVGTEPLSEEDSSLNEGVDVVVNITKRVRNIAGQQGLYLDGRVTNVSGKEIETLFLQVWVRDVGTGLLSDDRKNGSITFDTPLRAGESRSFALWEGGLIVFGHSQEIDIVLATDVHDGVTQGWERLRVRVVEE